MDLLSINTKSKHLRYSSQIIDRFDSKNYTNPPGNGLTQNEGWVTARFSPHPNSENILYLGDDPGNIGIFNIEKMSDNRAPLEDLQLHFFPAHNGAIMDIIGVPQKESSIVSISGDSTVRLWDLTRPTHSSELFFGHEGSVRSVNFAPDDPNIFVTGARDGLIKIWDTRVSICRKMDQDCRNSTITYKNAHPVVQGNEKSTPRSKGKMKNNGASVTSVVFVDGKTIVSASSNAETGIRLWDIRKPTHNGEGHPTRILKIPVTRQRQAGFGVTCLALDRFGSALFASCTNSIVFEYAVLSDVKSPVRAYSGANIRDYYTQVACSPIADLIACGSEDSKSVIWDVQDQYNYITDEMTIEDATRRRGTMPKWECKGHESKVLCVGWSSRGSYYMSMDDKGLRIWNENRKPKKDEENFEDQNPGIFYEKFERYKMTESEDAVTKIDSMKIWKTDCYSPQKRKNGKRPLAVGTSPFKGVQRSPMKKISKLSDSPLKEVNQQNYQTPQHRKTTVRPFFYKYPTENLPNFVYDQFLKSLIGKEESLKSLSKTSKKRIDDWWQNQAIGSTSSSENMTSPATRHRLPSVTEFGESACAKVLSEEQRNAIMSPKKLVVKANLTPKKEEKLKTTESRKTSRNLLHYFNKKS